LKTRQALYQNEQPQRGGDRFSVSESAMLKNFPRILLYTAAAIGVSVPLGALAFVGLALIGFWAMSTSLRKMPTIQDILLQGKAERRLASRVMFERNALLFFAGQPGLFGCSVRDVTNSGARICLNGLCILPVEFNLSFDNFRTTRWCRLVWRNDDFVGVKLAR
jgi:hypothetical protein